MSKSKIFFVLIVSFLLAGCGGNGDKVSILNGLKIEKVSLSSSQLPLNSIQTVRLDIDSPVNHTSEENETAVFVYFELTRLDNTDDNDTYSVNWSDSFVLPNIKQGSNSYEFNITIPSDVAIAPYSLYAEVSDQYSSLDNASSDAFSIISFGGKPQLELVSFRLGLEDGGIDSEYDTINSYLNTGVDMSQQMLQKGISLDDLNETLILDTTLVVRSRYMDIQDTKVKVCLEIYSECISMPILNMISGDTPSISHTSEEESGLVVQMPEQTFQLNLGDFYANEDKSFDLHIVINPEQVKDIINDTIQDIHAFASGTIEGKLKIEISSDNEGNMDLADNSASRPLNIQLSQEIYNLISSLQGSISLEELHAIASYLDDLNASSVLPEGITLGGGLPDINTSGIIPKMSKQQSLLGTMSSEKSVTGKCGLKKLNYAKEYKLNKYGRRFGAGAFLKGKAYLDSKGVHSSIYGSLRVRRFSDTKWRILRVSGSANIIPASFEDTGYDITLTSMGRQIYYIGDSIAESLGLDSPEVALTEEEKDKINNSNESNATDRNVTRESTLLRRKAYKAAKDKIKRYKETRSTLLSYGIGWRLGKIIERSTTMFFGPVPIVVTAGADARIGFDADIQLDGITSVTAMIEPNAYIGAYLQAGVGWGVSCCGKGIEYSAGIGGDLWLLSERFTTTVNASLEFAEDDEGEYIVALDGKLHNNITNYIQTMNGKVYAYARYTKWVCKKRWSNGICNSYGWKNYYRRKTFADWSGGKYTRELLDKEKTLFSVPIADNCE